jgi:hypothetical protein
MCVIALNQDQGAPHPQHAANNVDEAINTYA